MARRVLFFFGPPASGKGTQAEILSQELGLPTVSTGDLLRRQASLNTQQQTAIQGGQLINDQLINELLQQRLAADDVQAGFILDGYPRTKPQFEYFYNEIIQPDDQICAIEISVSEQEVYNRLLGRRYCPNCGRGYHLNYKPPQQTDYCDECSTKLEQRVDDQPNIVKERLALYQRTMGPLVALWWQLGELVIVKGEKDIPAVHQDILAALVEHNFLTMKPELL